MRAVMWRIRDRAWRCDPKDLVENPWCNLCQRAQPPSLALKVSIHLTRGKTFVPPLELFGGDLPQSQSTIGFVHVGIHCFKSKPAARLTSTDF